MRAFVVNRQAWSLKLEGSKTLEQIRLSGLLCNVLVLYNRQELGLQTMLV